MSKRFLLFFALASLIPILATVAVYFTPGLTEQAGVVPPSTVYYRPEPGSQGIEKPCSDEHAAWRQAQVIEGIEIDEALACEPDNPFDIAVAVKGANNVSMHTLMQSRIAEDALTMGEDLDNDGDPDIIHIKLEVVELNGASPDGEFLIDTYDIAPGIKPGLWVFAPKSSGMALKNFNSMAANPLLRAPSPVIRVEQGDKVLITLENTHYLPHTIHLHGVDHPAHNSEGDDNDGMEDHAVFPGKSHTYEIQPRHAGTMLYHCHVQTAQHYMMGLNGMFIVEPNRPNNWLQTFNIGAGQVRHPSATVRETFDREYDLFYQSVDKQLSQIIQNANDPRLVAQRMNREYNMTESFENYFLLNGRSFPYTLRDGLIVVNENEHIKLHVANAQRSPVALHIHGHKATITANDGVDVPKSMRITRDVYDIAPAQRIDLDLDTRNDGLHSYGPGAWMFHDHVPTGTTTDGMEPGGNIAFLGYTSALNEQGMPVAHQAMLDQAFNKDYYAKKQAVWSHGESAPLLGEAGPIAVNYLRLIAFGLAVGLAVGLLMVGLLLYRRRH